MGINLNPPSPPKLYDIFTRNMKIFDDDLSRAKKDIYRVTAEVFQDLNQLFWNLKDAELHLEVTASNDVVETGFHKVVNLKMRKAGLELWKLEKIFDSYQDPSKKITSQMCALFDKGILKIEAEIAEEETQNSPEYNFDMEVAEPVDQSAEDSAQEVYENVLLKAQKAISVEDIVENYETPLNVSNVKNDNLAKVKLSSFQEDLIVTSKILTLNGFKFRTKKSPDDSYVVNETDVDTVVEEHDVPPNDGGIPDQEKDMVKEESIFDFETSDATVELEKLEQFVEIAFEKDDDAAITLSENVKQKTTGVPSVFPFDPGEITEKEGVKADATSKVSDEDRKMILVEHKTEAKKKGKNETPAKEKGFVFLNVLKKLRLSMSNYLTTLFLFLLIPNLLNPLHMNTTSDVMTKETYPPTEIVHSQDTPEDMKEVDSTGEEATTATTFQNGSFPFDRGKTFDTTNDVEEAAAVDVDAGKTTPRDLIEDSDVHECSGSRSLIQDDLLFQQVAPSVVLCLHVCHIILRYPAILLAQLHMIYRHPASRYYVNNATKSFDFPDVNAERLLTRNHSIVKRTLKIVQRK